MSAAEREPVPVREHTAVIEVPRQVVLAYFGDASGSGRTLITRPPEHEPGMRELAAKVTDALGQLPVAARWDVEHLTLRFALPAERPALDRLYRMAVGAESFAFNRPRARPAVPDDPGIRIAHGLLRAAADLALSTMRALYAMPPRAVRGVATPDERSDDAPHP